MSRWWRFALAAAVSLLGSMVPGIGAADDLPVVDPRGYDINQVEPQQLLVAGDVVVWVIACEDDHGAVCGYGPLDPTHVIDEVLASPPEMFRIEGHRAEFGPVTIRSDGSAWVSVAGTTLVGVDVAGRYLGPIEVQVDCEVLHVVPDVVDDDLVWAGCEHEVWSLSHDGGLRSWHLLAIGELNHMVARPQGGVLAIEGTRASTLADGVYEVRGTVTDTVVALFAGADGLHAAVLADCDPLCEPVPALPEPVKPETGNLHKYQFSLVALNWDGDVQDRLIPLGTGQHETLVGAVLPDGRVMVALPTRSLSESNADDQASPLILVGNDRSLVNWVGASTCCPDVLVSGWDAVLHLQSIDGVSSFRRLAIDPFGTFMDDDASPFETQIESIAASGVTAGCHESGLLFCPSESVTRAQMATFLARFLGLALDAPDAFGDDGGNMHEASINAVAAAEITDGCDAADPGRFCPDTPVTRAQMATFMARALDLPAGPDRFTDDDGSVHEASINALAAAGITNGCDASDSTRFCPTAQIRRDHMAALLARASG